MARAIATHLLVDSQPTIVVVHVDGDRGWSDRDAEHGCDNLRSFRAQILSHVGALLEGRAMRARLDRLLEVVPFWCIESWLFQNTGEALKICEESGPRHADAAARFVRWRDEPHRLDEEVRPKTLVSFGAKHNLRLAAQGFPAKKVEQLGLSFAHVVGAARWSGVPELLAGLRHGS